MHYCWNLYYLLIAVFCDKVSRVGDIRWNFWLGDGSSEEISVWYGTSHCSWKGSGLRVLVRCRGA